MHTFTHLHMHTHTHTLTCTHKHTHAYTHHSSFNLDAFKRVYSNEDTATKAVPYFWENFDPEGWSIWKADYNYNDDLKYLFMSSNLVSGMMQRLDKLRKYAFASVLILGQDNDNCISGIWVMRGQELAFDVSCGGPQTCS